MRIGQFIDFLTATLPKGKIIMAIGAPGVGKTYGKMEAARRAGMDYIGICTPLCDPAFIGGYPYRENGTASFAPFGQLARALKADKPTLLDFDEMPAASESVVKAALRLFQFREVADKRLPDCVVLSASGNDVTHGCGVFGFNEAMKDRFHSIITVEPNLEDTIAYGLTRGWPTDLLAYLRNAPDALHDWKPSKDMSCSGATPRGWEEVANWINIGVDDSEVIAGKVGKGRATQYLAFRQLISELPDIDGCLIDPDSSPVPENPSARYLVSMALASRMDGKTFGQAVKYLHRLPAMFRAFAIRDAFRAESEKKKAGKLASDHKLLSQSRDFTAWLCTQDGKDIISAGA